MSNLNTQNKTLILQFIDIVMSDTKNMQRIEYKTKSKHKFHTVQKPIYII